MARRAPTAFGASTKLLVAVVASAAATVGLYSIDPAGVGIFEARDAMGNVTREGVFVSDGFTHFFRLIGAIVAGMIVLSSTSFLRARSASKGEFYTFILLATFAMNLMAGANDLIIVALGIEFLSITSYVLTGYLRTDEQSTEAGLKYFLYGSIASAAMLFGLTWVFGAAGTTSLPDLAEMIAQPESRLVLEMDAVLLPALLLVMAGIGFKIAAVPFHQWSPDAYEGAPTPITSFLSVGPKAAGFALMLRFFVSIYGDAVLTADVMGVLVVLAALTMIVGNVAALAQTNVKRLMAYSSIAQAGYMLVGVVAYAGDMLHGITALGSVLFFILAYVFTNLGVFGVIIAVDEAHGHANLSAFDGLIRRSPLFAATLAVLFLSLIGIPPLSGFMGKFAVFGAAVTSGHVALALVGVLTGVISAAYYFKVIKAMFFNEAPAGAGALRPSPTLVFVVVASLVMTLAIGLVAQPFLEITNSAAATVAPDIAAVVSGH